MNIKNNGKGRCKKMKATKKLMLWLTMAAMTVCLGACSDEAGRDGKEGKETKKVEASAGSENKEKEKDKKAPSGNLTDHAQKILDLILEKANNETYLELITSTASMKESDEYQKLVSADYSSPEKIYQVRFKEEFNNLMINVALKGSSAKLDNLSEELIKDIKGRLSTSFMTMLNARKSAQTVALTSVLTTGCLYLDESMTADSGMLVYCYKDAYPLAVNYEVTEDGIVSMSGTPIFIDEFKADSAGDVVTSLLGFFPDEFKYLAGTDVEVEVIQ